MPLTVPEALGFIPKVITTIEKCVDTVKEINVLPVKNFKTVGGALGVASGSALGALLDLADDVVTAAKS